MQTLALWLFISLNPWGEIEVEGPMKKELCVLRIEDFKGYNLQQQCVYTKQPARKITPEGENIGEQRMKEKE